MTQDYNKQDNTYDTAQAQEETVWYLQLRRDLRNFGYDLLTYTLTLYIQVDLIMCYISTVFSKALAALPFILILW